MDHRFGLCPSGLLNVSRYFRGIYFSLMCPLSPPVSLRPQTRSVCPLWWGLGPGCSRPVGFCPACVSDPGKEREGECGGVSRWLVPRGSSPARLQAASLGWSIRTAVLQPRLRGLLLLSGALLLVHTCGLPAKGKFRLRQTPGGLGSCHPPISRPSEAASIT